MNALDRNLVGYDVQRSMLTMLQLLIRIMLGEIVLILVHKSIAVEWLRRHPPLQRKR